MTLLAAGDSLDRYTIVGLLGTGGMGAVYKAVDPRLEREVALKVLRVDFAATSAEALSEGKALLLREARAAAALEHPNVVTIHDVAEAVDSKAHPGTPYLVMELVEGMSLHYAAPDAPLEIRVRWLGDVARALAAAHERGLLHRDVKPANVMIRRDGVVKVLDFGIAKRLAPRVNKEADTVSASVSLPATEDGRVVGTPSYLAPEQLRGDKIDARVDQFAWGVTAYEVLCGKRPWEHPADSVHLVAEILSRDPPHPCEVNPEIPAHVGDVVMRAMAKAPNDRFATADDLVLALSSSQTVEGPPSSRREPAPAAPVRATSPKRSKLPLAAAVVIVLVGAGALALALRGRPPAPASPVETTVGTPSATSIPTDASSAPVPPSAVASVTVDPVPSAKGPRPGKPPRGPAAHASSGPPLFFPGKR